MSLPNSYSASYPASEVVGGLPSWEEKSRTLCDNPPDDFQDQMRALIEGSDTSVGYEGTTDVERAKTVQTHLRYPAPQLTPAMSANVLTLGRGLLAAGSSLTDAATQIAANIPPPARGNTGTSSAEQARMEVSYLCEIVILLDSLRVGQSNPS